jgi:hypothetical protein|tara:strand:+ start:274 stop:603 length:330 start_codon:yes stop_codon:yes gene_type:complete
MFNRIHLNIIRHVHIIMDSKAVDKLEKIKLQIEKMNIAQQVEVLKILNGDDKVILNENKSGIYVNLSFLPEEVVDKIDNYVKYVQDQEKSLNVIEDKKENVKNEYFETL